MPDPVAFVQQRLGELLQQAKELRVVVLPAPGASPQDFYDKLLEVRARTDRMEELLLDAVGLRGGTARNARTAQEAADDSWDIVAQRARSRSVQQREFEGARERYVDWNLETLPQRRAAREAAKIAEMARECEDKMRLMHRGLDGTRQDLIAVLHGMRFRDHLESG